MLRNMLICMVGGMLLVGCASPGMRTNPDGNVRIQNTHTPSGIQSRDEKTGIGVDVKNEDNWRGSKTTITPFIGENPYYNKGWRAEKKRMEALRKQGEYKMALELAREDAREGEFRNYEGVPGKFVWAYDQEFDRVRQSMERRGRHQYERGEYRRGQSEFWQAHPGKEREMRAIEFVKVKARRDAQDGVYDVDGFDPQLIPFYEEAHQDESERLRNRRHWW